MRKKKRKTEFERKMRNLIRPKEGEKENEIKGIDWEEEIATKEIELRKDQMEKEERKDKEKTMLKSFELLRLCMDILQEEGET